MKNNLATAIKIIAWSEILIGIIFPGMVIIVSSVWWHILLSLLSGIVYVFLGWNLKKTNKRWSRYISIIVFGLSIFIAYGLYLFSVINDKNDIAYEIMELFNQSPGIILSYLFPFSILGRLFLYGYFMSIHEDLDSSFIFLIMSILFFLSQIVSLIILISSKKILFPNGKRNKEIG